MNRNKLSRPTIRRTTSIENWIMYHNKIKFDFFLLSLALALALNINFQLYCYFCSLSKSQYLIFQVDHQAHIILWFVKFPSFHLNGSPTDTPVDDDDERAFTTCSNGAGWLVGWLSWLFLLLLLLCKYTNFVLSCTIDGWMDGCEWMNEPTNELYRIYSATIYLIYFNINTRTHNSNHNQSNWFGSYWDSENAGRILCANRILECGEYQRNQPIYIDLTSVWVCLTKFSKHTQPAPASKAELKMENFYSRIWFVGCAGGWSSGASVPQHKHTLYLNHPSYRWKIQPFDGNAECLPSNKNEYMLARSLARLLCVCFFFLSIQFVFGWVLKIWFWWLAVKSLSLALAIVLALARSISLFVRW